MANIDFARGLQVHGPLLRATLYTLTSNYAADVFIGDPLAGANTGYVALATPGSTYATIGPAIAIYDKDMVPLQYWDSGHSGLGYVLVADHPDQLFEIQGDGDTSYLDLADQLSNVSMLSAAGSTVNYRSGWELDDSETGSNDPNKQIRLIKPVNRPGNTIATANCDWIVRINNHQGAIGIVGAGI